LYWCEGEKDGTRRGGIKKNSKKRGDGEAENKNKSNR
jgi:hypothetical protein